MKSVNIICKLNMRNSCLIYRHYLCLKYEDKVLQSKNFFFSKIQYAMFQLC